MDARTTLRGNVARAVARNTAWAVAVLASWGAVTALAPSVDAGLVTQPAPAVDRVTALVDRQECWTGAAPQGADPSRAVVTLPHQRARVVAAEIGYRIWLEGRPGVVHAFCP